MPFYRIGCVFGEIEPISALPCDATFNRNEFETFCLYGIEASDANQIPNRIFPNIFGDVYLFVKNFGEVVIESIDDLILLHDREREQDLLTRRTYTDLFNDLCAEVADSHMLCMHGFLHTHPQSPAHLNWKKLMDTEFPFNNYTIYLQTSHLPNDMKKLSLSSRVCGTTF